MAYNTVQITLKYTEVFQSPLSTQHSVSSLHRIWVFYSFCIEIRISFATFSECGFLLCLGIPSDELELVVLGLNCLSKQIPPGRHSWICDLTGKQ